MAARSGSGAGARRPPPAIALQLRDAVLCLDNRSLQDQGVLAGEALFKSPSISPQDLDAGLRCVMEGVGDRTPLTRKLRYKCAWAGGRWAADGVGGGRGGGRSGGRRHLVLGAENFKPAPFPSHPFLARTHAGCARSPCVRTRPSPGRAARCCGCATAQQRGWARRSTGRQVGRGG